MRLRASLETYMAVARISFRNARQYAVDFLTHFAYFPAELVALFFVYSVVYQQVWAAEGSTSIGGFTLHQLVAYLFVTLMIQKALPQRRMSIQIERDIDLGYLVGYLSRPVDYTGYRFFAELPRSLLYLVMGALTYLAGMLLLGLPAPSPANLALFILLLLAAYTISFLLVFTTSLATFWVGRQWWLRNLISLLTLIAGGGLIPLTFFPPIAQQILALLPFQYCYFVPVSALQGHYDPAQLGQVLLLDAAWLAILWLASRATWRFGLRRYEGAGG